jgi:hypothetical protein
MKLSPVTLAAAALALLGPAAAARAELIHWTYDWSRSPARVNADAPGTGYITLSDEGLKAATGYSDVVATNLRTYSTAPTANPDHFTAKPYTLSLYLFDNDSGLGGTVRFTGQLDGTLTEKSANIRNTFTGPTTQELVLGDHRYKATIGPYASPGPTGSVNAGSISAHVSVTVESLMDLPEPSALALSCLGLAVLGLRRLRRRAR